jgi:formiminoglutamase
MQPNDAVDIRRGDGPVVLAMPHVGTFVPDDIVAQLNAEGRVLRDADWRVDALYDGLLPGATVLRARFHRYVIDANRDPSGAALYPGQNATALVPTTNFDGAPIWTVEPDAAAIASRRGRWHAPYHAALAGEIDRVKARWGCVILYDCHSIRSRIPFLFDGELPALNIGAFNGRSCAPAVVDIARRAAAPFDHVVDGRFKGGYTIRHYGAPEEGVHAIQMEIAQRLYLATESPPFAYDPGRAAPLRAALAGLLAALDAFARQEGGR